MLHCGQLPIKSRISKRPTPRPVCCRPRLGREDVSYDSTLVDDEAYSPWDQSEGLLYAVGFSNGSVWVAQEYEGKLVSRSEGVMRLLVIVAYSDDFSPEVLEFLI